MYINIFLSHKIQNYFLIIAIKRDNKYISNFNCISVIKKSRYDRKIYFEILVNS